MDANYFLRYLVLAATPQDRAMAAQARALFEAVGRGEEKITTTEVVPHEVVYVLGSKAVYGRDVGEIAAGLQTLLRMPGFHLPRGDKRRYLRALEIWTTHPVIGFPDAIVAASVEELDIPLATFGRQFDRLGLERWQPPASG